MADGKLEIKIPEDLIRSQLIVEMAKQMPNRDQVIDAVISAALTEKENSYDRETKFGNAMKKMIREAAGAVFGEWLKGQEAAIKEKLLKRLEAEKSKVLKKIVDDWVAGMGKFSVSCSLSIIE